MFKIAIAVKQIFKSASNVRHLVTTSINSMLKYCTQSKGYIEDASEEFTFLKVLPSQLSKGSIQNEFSIFTLNTQKVAAEKSMHLIDSAEIRKLIYARFASEIGTSQRNSAENKNLENKNFETKSHATREHIETFTTYNIADEFKELRSQGYDFAGARKAMQNQSVKSLSERMKELSISGYISNYAGDPHLREDIEKVSIQKELVINEFMARCAVELEEHSTELLG